jgi:hypothetical protein
VADHDLDDRFVKPVTNQEATSLRALGKMPGRQRRVRFYYMLTNWLLRTGLGSYLVRALGERRISRLRHAFTQSGHRKSLVSKPLTSPIASKGDDTETETGSGFGVR